MPKTSGTRAAVLSASVAVAVGLLAAICWKDFAVAYYAHRMESDPAFLNEVLSDPASGINAEAFERFARKPTAVPILLASLATDPWDPFDDQNVPAIAGALLKIGELAIPDLLDALDSSGLRKSQGQDKLLAVLERLGPAAETAVPAVTRQLQHSHWEIREMAVRALDSIASDSGAAIAALEDAAAEHDEDDIRRMAKAALLGHRSGGNTTAAAGGGTSDEAR